MTPDHTAAATPSILRKNPGFLQDRNGANSSKRLCGVILLSIGMAMGVTIFIFGLQNPSAIYRASFSVMKDFLIAGTSLLGLGLVENLNRIFEKPSGTGK